MTVNVATSAASPARTKFARHAALLAGVSAAAMFMASPEAYAKPLGGWTPAPSAAAVAAAQSGSQEAARAAKAASNSLKRATQAIQAMQASQQAARDAARQALQAMPSGIPNGLRPGGLQVAPGATVGSNLWQGANLPTEFADGGRTKVTVGQTQQKAILTWQTFNVSENTDLRFDQQGNRNWVALNRVLDNTAPSKILGSIRADGSVYVINQNGIIFGGTSQVNVGALIASTASISNDQFLNNGIYSQQASGSYLPSFTGASGLVKIEAGAELTTHEPKSVTAGGGFVLLMGIEVENAGSIATPKGQALLAAGDDFLLRPGFGTDANQGSTTRGSELRALIGDGSAAGAVTNSGLIFAQQGDITLTGRTLAQNGVLVSTTSVHTRGTVHLLNSASDSLGSVTLGSESLIAILPELDSTETALDSQRAASIAAGGSGNAATGQYNHLSTLSDRKDQSRVEIVTGGDVIFKAGSITQAQGGQVAVTAGRRIFTESGSTIDVSGVRDVLLPMSANNIRVNIQGNELRDSPVNRDENYLKNEDVWVDIRDLILLPDGTGGYKGDRYYTPGGLLEIGGYLANTAHKIGEWTALGGTITLSAPEVVAQKGSVFNISGGSVAYQGGYIRTSNFMDGNGRTVNINRARGDQMFYGLSTGFVRKSERWGITEVWSHPFGRGRTSLRWEDGYTVGRDAGSLDLSTPTAIFEGTIVADVVKGERQIKARPDNVTDGYKLTQNIVAQAGGLMLGSYTSQGFLTSIAPTYVRFADIESIADTLAGASLPTDRVNTAWFDADSLSEFGLGRLRIATTRDVAFDGALTLNDGGRLLVFAPIVDVKADITVRSGDVTITNIAPGSSDNVGITFQGAAGISVGAAAAIDTRGLWINARLDQNKISGLAHLDGGDVMLRSTKDVLLERGSLIDASSGGAVLADGLRTGGRGGGISLLADVGATGSTAGIANPGEVGLRLDGTVRSLGVTGGGTLTLSSARPIVIGDLGSLNDGRLESGEAAPANVRLAQTIIVRAGERLPVGVTDTLTRTPVDTPLPVNAQPTWTQPIQITASWTVPSGIGDVFTQSHGSFSAGQTVPTGAVITLTTGALDAGYIVPSSVFPNGVAIQATYAPISAGAIARRDYTIAAGTVIQKGAVFNQPVQIEAPVHLAANFFQQGFSSYDITGGGVTVTDGTKLDVVMPVLRFTNSSFTTRTGADTAGALAAWLPPLHTENSVSAMLLRRGGASLALNGYNPNIATASSQIALGEATGRSYGAVSIGAGAMIAVDPQQAVSINAPGQITIHGGISAAGGEITILNTRALWTEVQADPLGLSIWLGENGVLDVAGRAYTAQDRNGRIYGEILDGGTVRIGALDRSVDTGGYLRTSEAYVILRPGSRIEASGAAANIDIAAGLPKRSSSPLWVSSHGGTIALTSFSGIYLDGALRAAAGGGNSLGGRLEISVDTPIYRNNIALSDAVKHARMITLGESRTPSLLPDDLGAGETHASLVTTGVRISAKQVRQGGFDSLSLYGGDAIEVEGNLNFRLGRSIELLGEKFGLAQGSQDAFVALAAPYVLFDLTRAVQRGSNFYPGSVARDLTGPLAEGTANLSVTADLIDLRGLINFGPRSGQRFSLQTSEFFAIRSPGPVPTGAPGFDNVSLYSRGDIRFLVREEGNPVIATEVRAVGDLTLTAAQLYPVTEAFASVTAGKVLKIARSTAALPSMPFSVFGSLRLTGGSVEQGGVVRVPFGLLHIEATDAVAAGGQVRLLPGSVTSASGAGLLMPFGGTADGLNYLYNGENVTQRLNTSSISDRVERGVRLAAPQINVVEGAIVDLSGGGDLAGIAFLAGRGGSVDVLRTPLINANPANAFSRSGNQVFAIVPGHSGNYAPLGTEEGLAAPEFGRQIRIPEGVPGLRAGTYTLLPANFALLPGAFRVEIGPETGRTAQAAPAMNGSYFVPAQLGIANTGTVDANARQVLLTPANAVRRLARYNETSYSDFARAQLVSPGNPFKYTYGFLPENAGALYLYFANPAANPLSFKGEARFEAAQGGRRGALMITSFDSAIEVRAADSAPTAGMLSLVDDDLNAFNTGTMAIGSTYWVTHEFPSGEPSRPRLLLGGSSDITVRNGATLSAGQVLLLGNITIESGSSIDTIGRGASSLGSVTFGAAPASASMLSVSNDDFLLGTAVRPTGLITIGDDASLLSEGSITFVIDQADLGDINIGTRTLSLALDTINIGTDTALAAATAAGQVPDGWRLDTSALARLLQGGVAGAPAIETLALSVSSSLNFFGTVTLDTASSNRSSEVSLVLNTPAIYGWGAAGDVATIRTSRLIWNGLTEELSLDDVRAISPGPVLPGGPGTGAGRLNLAADEIILGATGTTEAELSRIALGFDTVNLIASKRITATKHRGSLSAYRSGTDAATYAGGRLNLVTPLLTGEGAADIVFRTGGALSVTAPAHGAAATSAIDVLGATIELDGDTVSLDTAVGLPTGRLAIKARGDVTLGDDTRIDLSGRSIAFFDQTRHSWGGELSIESLEGSVRFAAGSLVDISAARSDAGLIRIKAPEGVLSLDGRLSGEGGAGFEDGEFGVWTRTLTGFAGLNTRLSDAGFFGARSFAIGEGDLIVGNEVRASKVTISVNGGGLTVNGKIDASGEKVGNIRLSARDALTLGANAMLDAHGTVLRTDAYDAPIEASNRGFVELTSTEGSVTLLSGARIDLRSADSIARGKLEINAPRIGGDDIAIDARGSLDVRGAASIAVNAFLSYTPSDGTVTQSYMDDVHADSRAFIDAANANTVLQGKLAGLAAYGDSFHLRPGVEILSNGDLTVFADIDLSGYRYGPDIVAGLRGSGEPGVLLIRAGGDLDIKGSINDGFAPPPLTPDDNGWRLVGLLATDEIAPFGGTLLGASSGTVSTVATFPGGANSTAVLSFPITVRPGSTTVNRLRPAVTIPFEFASNGSLSAGSGWTATAPIWASAAAKNQGQAPRFRAGDRVTVSLASGTYFGAGTVLPGAVAIAQTVIPARTPLNVFNVPNIVLGANVTIPVGAILPAGTNIRGDVSFRPTGTDGRQGAMWAIAPMLAPGSQSWSMRLLAGADLSSADTRGLQQANAGSMTLSDRHYVGPTELRLPAPSVVRTGIGYLDMLAAGDFGMESLFGVYTAGTQSSGIDPIYNPPRSRRPDGTIVGASNSQYEALAAGAQAYYPEHGGDILLKARGELSGHIVAGSSTAPFARTDEVGNWLWRQGGEELGQSAAWWINFGSYGPGRLATGQSFSDGVPTIQGFTGVGALGGGNVTVLSGGDVGRPLPVSAQYEDKGFVVAVGGTGRVGPDGRLTQTGGGDIDFTVGRLIRRGVVVNPRGDIEIDAGRISSLPQISQFELNSNLLVVPGDGDARLRTLRDLQSVTTADPGRVPLQNATLASLNGLQGDGLSWFSLWTNRSTLEAMSAGGDLRIAGSAPTLLATAFSGSGVLEGTLAPSPQGQVELLVRESIKGVGTLILSGADLSTLATPFNPGFAVYDPRVSFGRSIIATNHRRALGTDLPVLEAADVYLDLFTFGPDTVTSNLHAGDNSPARFYAVNGDIFRLRFGELSLPPLSGATGGTRVYRNAKPFRIWAGRDIIELGSPALYNSSQPVSPVGVFALHDDPTDVSIIRAGRDILFSNAYVAGPGLLEVRAGRELFQGSRGVLRSIGPIIDVDPQDRASGASIAAMAGVGANGPDYAAFARLYLDPANLLPVGTPLQGSGKVVETYQKELTEWLADRFGYAGAETGALAYFAALPAEQQGVFVRQVYFEELRQGGREYNDSEGPRFASYLRGRQAIATLFPERSSAGQPIRYDGGITLYTSIERYNGGTVLPPGSPGLDYQTDSLISTDFGGDVQLLVPGGVTTIGIEGIIPRANSGLLSQGFGNIQIYSLDDIRLGLSRVFTTFGGDITMWSAEGDINAGRGAKGTVVYAPARRVYDTYGNVALSPTVPSSGAGIATLNPIPEVLPGDIDLIAPLGTIDAGEAGIRSSANINLAALHIVNAANIQAQGKTTGVPTIQAPNIAGLTEASNAAGAAAQQAATPQHGSGNAQPSIIIVEVLGFGGGDGEDVQPANPQRRSRQRQSGNTNYEPTGMVRILGDGAVTAEGMTQLTEEERSTLASQNDQPSSP